jgi:excisionase family DNA binding protein
MRAILTFLASLLVATTVAVGADIATSLMPTIQAFTTSAAPAAYAFVDHAVHTFTNVGAFVAVVAAPLAPTVPFAVSIPEAARLIGISRGLVYQLIAAGELEIVKIGTRTVIRTDVIQRFLAANVGTLDPNLSPMKRGAASTPKPTPAPAPIEPADIATP